MVISKMNSLLLINNVINNINDKDVEELGKKTLDILSIIKNFNYISIYQWLVDNAWITVTGYRVPLVVLFIIGFILLTYIARKIRSIAIILIVAALIAFANTFVQFTVGA